MRRQRRYLGGWRHGEVSSLVAAANVQSADGARHRAEASSIVRHVMHDTFCFAVQSRQPLQTTQSSLPMQA